MPEWETMPRPSSGADGGSFDGGFDGADGFDGFDGGFEGFGGGVIGSADAHDRAKKR